MKEFKFKLGYQVKDKITGLTGLVTGQVRYITGCDQFSVQPIGDGSKIPESYWIDEGRLVRLKNGSVEITAADVSASDNGCMNPAPLK